jgi:hypothetical protein
MYLSGVRIHSGEEQVILSQRPNHSATDAPDTDISVFEVIKAKLGKTSGIGCIPTDVLIK